MLQGLDQRLCDRFDVALLDLDGVVYVGPDAVPAAPAALSAARDAGMQLAFVTNNAARPPDRVAAHLTELGIAATADQVINSAQAAARYLAERLPAAARVLVLGTTGLTTALRERGLTPVSDATGQVDAVVQGYSPDMNWALLAEGAVAINRGVLWVATNVDPTVPSPRGPLPGNGSLVAALKLATGVEPVVTGKPDPTMHRETLLRTGAQRPIVVGDRLDTDIEGANAVGCPSLLVFSGVTTARDLLAAPPKLRPSFIAADVSGLLTGHPETVLSGATSGNNATARCGRWQATAAGSRISLERRDGATASAAAPGDGDALDALRALCSIAWQPGSADLASGTDGTSGSRFAITAAEPAAHAVIVALGLD